MHELLGCACSIHPSARFFYIHLQQKNKHQHGCGVILYDFTSWFHIPQPPTHHLSRNVVVTSQHDVTGLATGPQVDGHVAVIVPAMSAYVFASNPRRRQITWGRGRDELPAMVNVQKGNWKNAIEIVDSPIFLYLMVILRSYVNVYQRVSSDDVFCRFTGDF